MQGAPHILIVDDHREIRDLVSRALTKDGFRVSVAADGRAMRKVLADGRIDLILLDLMLPGEDGLSLCRGLRAKSSIPIIMLTAKGDEVDRVIGLEMGADDYLPKPFGSRELVARIRAVLRRSRDKTPPPDDPGQRPKHYRFDRWRLDTGRASCSATMASPCRSAPANTICWSPWWSGRSACSAAISCSTWRAAAPPTRSTAASTRR